jgi:hypothetical protein
MKKILLSIFLCFIIISGITVPSLTVSANQEVTSSEIKFNDVKTGDRFAEEIMFLTSENVILGFLDGSFKPNNLVSRAQAAIMIGRALDLDGTQRSTKFNDVPSSSVASGYIASAVEKGIISGFKDGTYKPGEPVTRGQMAIFLNRAFKLTEGKSNSFKDVRTGMAAYQAILNVTADGIAIGYTDGTYRPDEPVLRGAFSAFMARTLEPSFRSVPTKPTPEPPLVTEFANCTELREVYPDGVSSSHPAYQSKMDRDKDGWACE